MKKKKTKEFSYKQLISNTLFVLKFLFKTNKKLFFARVPVLVLQIISPFIPIIFIKYILDAITVEDNMSQTIFYVVTMALVTLIANTLSNIFSTLDQSQVSKTRHLANLVLGKSTMRFQYSDLEKPETKTFVALAQEDSMIYILTLVTNLISSVAKRCV